jgi:hypothetical protein
MANIDPAESGLPTCINCVAQQSHHGPRVKVSSSATSARKSLLVSTVAVQSDRTEGVPLSPKDLSILRKWIVLNYPAIMDFWNNRILTQDFQLRIKSIAGKETDAKLDWDAHIQRLKAGSNTP